MPRDGRFPEPLREGVVPPTADELSAWTGPARRGGPRGAGRGPDGRRAAEDFYLRTWAEPSVDVHGIAGGSPRLIKTVLPVHAEANASIRLVPDQDPRRSPLRSSACPGSSARWRGVGGDGSVQEPASAHPPRRARSLGRRAGRVRARRRPAAAARAVRRLHPPWLPSARRFRRSSPASASPTRTSIHRTNGSRWNTSRLAWTRLSSRCAGSAGWRTRNGGGAERRGAMRARWRRSLRPMSSTASSGTPGSTRRPSRARPRTRAASDSSTSRASCWRSCVGSASRTRS